MRYVLIIMQARSVCAKYSHSMRKNNMKIWACALMLMAPSVCLVSCGDDDPEDSNVTGKPDDGKPITPDEPSKDEALSPSEQKMRLESIAMDFMNEVPSSDFKDINDFVRYISEEYEDYDYSNVEDWANDILDGLSSYVGTSNETVSDYWGTEVYFYTDYTALVAISNFTGHFVADSKDRTWTMSKANDLQFSFKDKNGRDCVLKLTCGGNTKEVNVCYIEDWEDYKYDNSTQIYYEYFKRTDYTVKVPEHINVSLTRGGGTMVDAKVDIDLSGITDKDFNLSKNSLAATSTVTLNNGYVIKQSRGAYNANKSVSAQMSVVKNGKMLMTAAISSDLSGIPSCNLKAFIDDPDDFDTDNVNLKNAYVKINIMDKLQVQGTISDVRKYADYIDEADMNEESESKFKSYINQANSLSDIYLFYDNGSTKQAAMTLEAFEESDYYGRFWYAEPVLEFFDGSSYSTFSTFFNKKDFKNVIDSYEDLLDEYADMLE